MNDESKDAQSLPAVELTDHYLQTLVKIVNNADERLCLPMTVLVGGTLVSGSLIRVEEYFETFTSEFSSIFTDAETASSVKETFSPPQDMPAPSDDEPLPQYIHFKDAKFYSAPGDPIVAGHGVLWRGRIAEVGGFYFGRLAPLSA
jgi:hypothetical protein